MTFYILLQTWFTSKWFLALFTRMQYRAVYSTVMFLEGSFCVVLPITLTTGEIFFGMSFFVSGQICLCSEFLSTFVTNKRIHYWKYKAVNIKYIQRKHITIRIITYIGWEVKAYWSDGNLTWDCQGDIVCMCQCQIRAHVNRGKSLCLPLLAANYVTNQHFRVFAPLLCTV